MTRTFATKVFAAAYWLLVVLFQLADFQRRGRS